MLAWFTCKASFCALSKVIKVMGLRNDYPYDEALTDVEDFFRRRVKDEASRSKLIELLKNVDLLSECLLDISITNTSNTRTIKKKNKPKVTVR